MSKPVEQALCQEGERKIQAGDLAGARAIWRQLCELAPANVDHWLILAGIDEQLGFPDSALQQLEQAKRLEPEDAELWLQSARLRWQQQQYQPALDDWHYALSTNFCDSELRYTIAERAFQCGQYALSQCHLIYLLHGSTLAPNARGLYIATLFFQKKLVRQLPKDHSLAAFGSKQSLRYAAQFLLAKVHPDDGIERLRESASSSLKSKAWFAALLDSITPDAGSYFLHAAQFPQESSKKSKWLNQTAVKRYHGLLEQLQAAPQALHHVYHFGCGDGRFAAQLRARGLRLCLSGIDVADMLGVVASNRHYDQLLSYEDWQAHHTQLLNKPCLLVISESAQYLAQERIYSLLRANTQTIVCIESPTADLRAYVHQAHSAGDVVSQALRDLLVVAHPDNSELINKGLKTRPRPITDKESHANKLIAVRQCIDQNSFDQAANMLAQTWAKEWNNPDLYYAKGVLAQHNKDYTEAISLFRKAIHLSSGIGAFWFQLGTVWQALGRTRSMLRAYQRALQYAPNHILSLSNLLVFWHTQKNWAQVFSICSQLVHAYPLDDSLRARCAAAVSVTDASTQQQYANLFESVSWLRAHFNACLERQFFQRTSASLAKLETILPPAEYDQLERALLKKQGRIDELYRRLSQAVEQDPSNLELQKELRDVQLNSGDLSAASDTWQKLRPKLDCKDSNIQNGLFSANYFPNLRSEQLAQQHFQWGQKLEATTDLASNSAGQSGLKTRASAGKKIRVAYLSGDIKFHSVSMFLHNIFKWHNAKRFELYVYMTGPSEDSMTIKLRSYAVKYRNIAQLNDEQAERLIVADQIDILVELAGHTAYNRLPLMARKPAPIQCTYLGYANTTGLSRIDYRISDAQADPSALDDELHSEELVRLPCGFLSYSRHFDSPPVKLRPFNRQRPNFEFVCCNNALKVNAQSLALFSKVLLAVPGSRLLIKAHNLDNEHIIQRYRQLFADQGITQERVHLMNALDMEDHQELYNHARIALDPSPYSGTTTTCDALWMGVPVLSLYGQRHAARVSASILHRIGLDDWVAHSESEFVAKAVKFVQATDDLALLKVTLRERMLASSLMQPTAVVQELENAFSRMLERAHH